MMKKITFKPTFETKRLEVNGKVYEVLLNDTEIIQSALKVEKTLKGLNLDTIRAGKSTEEINDVMSFMTESVDAMIGKGALSDIMGGRTPSINQCVELYRCISGAIMEIYEEETQAKFGAAAGA